MDMFNIHLSDHHRLLKGIQMRIIMEKKKKSMKSDPDNLWDMRLMDIPI